MDFITLGLQSALANTCKSLGYTEPTPIQKRAIPELLKGSDIIAIAETGTGKTAAFLLPILHRLFEDKQKGITALVLAPTRELALQTEAAFRDLSSKKFRCVSLIGGASIRRQEDTIRKGVSLIVATPGRLMDFMQRGVIDFSKLDTLVLDEADRMLDMGFLPAIKRIIAALPVNRQTLLFSATMSSEIEKIARTTMHNPKVIEVSRPGKTASTIEQFAYPVATQSKTVLLLDLLERERFSRVLVFTRTKREAERLSHILEARDHTVNRIHANRSQAQRQVALLNFKSGKTRILVATDIASRGIDVDSISHVINYNVPDAPEDYVHRIGRTGRAGNKGRAITLVTSDEESNLRAIERMTGQNVERVLLPNFGGTIQPAVSNSMKFLGGSKTSRPATRSFRPRR
jgi:ATP-dependent RNA helicase RhlE